MKHPNVIKIGIFAAYGLAIAIGFYNVRMSAIGLANGGDITGMDWSLAAGMMAFETCLSVSLGTPSFWPILLSTADSAIQGIIDVSDGRQKYQFAALGLLIIFVGLLCYFTYGVYKLDYDTTAAAIFLDRNPTQGDTAKVVGLVWGPECLLVAAGLAGLAGGVSKVQYQQISKRSEQLAAHYETGLYPDCGPNLND